MTLAPLTSLGLVSSHTNLLATGQRRYAIKRGFCSANAEQNRSRRIPCPPPHSPAPQGVSSTAGCPILVAFFAARVGILILLRIITAAPQPPHKLPHRLRARSLLRECGAKPQSKDPLPAATFTSPARSFRHGRVPHPSRVLCG